MAVLKNAQKSNIKVRAFVADAKAVRAQALLQHGAELYEGTLDDRGSLERAITGCTGVFLNQMPSFFDDGETRDAKLVLEVAKKAGVKHIVHSTSLGVPRKELFLSSGSIIAAAVTGKADVEDLVKASDFQYWTILRGGFFNTNFIGFSARYMFPELGKEKKFICSYKPDMLLPLIDPFDIGAFAIAAFDEPSKYHQQVIAVAAEKRTVERIVKDLSNASGHEIQAIYRTDEETAELAKTNPLAGGADLMDGLHEEVNVEAIKQWGVRLHTLPEFLENEKASVKATFDGSFDMPEKFPLFDSLKA